MESLLSALSQHGYSILFALVLAEAVGLPVPAALALLIAGGASATGSLQFPLVAACAISAMVLGDTLMFLMGRYTGWWLLGVLCRLSLNPESCVMTSADSFYRRGRGVLVFGKFVPGLNTMAPPLAGSMNMRFGQFLMLDFAGSFLYAGAYLGVGFLFSGVLEAITKNYLMVSNVLTWAIVAAVAGYLGFQAWLWHKARGLRSIPYVSPAHAAKELAAETAVIYDVRSHGYYDPKAMRATGSKRLEPNALLHLDDHFPAGKLIYLYCTCVREATSARVARHLLGKGLSAAVIKGGLRAWKKAGLPMERVPVEEISALPVFD
jgi:membrane protein DedA with SNARE-associated domain/rhodanese-related sulfurtransferase